MAVTQTVRRVRVGSGAWAERLVCHPRLPLVAGLDADGYEAPVFSADGRRFAIRGNAYENSLAVFEFPSLKLVLATTLGIPAPATRIRKGGLSSCAPGRGTTSRSELSPACCGSGRRES